MRPHKPVFNTDCYVPISTQLGLDVMTEQTEEIVKSMKEELDNNESTAGKDKVIGAPLDTNDNTNNNSGDGGIKVIGTKSNLPVVFKNPIKLKWDAPVAEGINPELGPLIEILKLRRINGGLAEQALIDDFIRPAGAKKDKFGNYCLVIPKADGTKSKVLWSCHTDSVHHTDGTQKLSIDEKGILTSNNGNCLGADDGSGIFILLSLIKAKMPGTYLFHRQEETGHWGSSWRRKNKATQLKTHNFAIAFDRRGTTSIITHQGFRTCSDAFADSLATVLDMGHKKDNTGTFTDTKVYEDVIPECTNVSVGYYSEHTTNERQDTEYLLNLRDALINNFDEDKLVVARDITAKRDWPTYSWSRGNNSNTSTNYNYTGNGYYEFDGGYGHGGSVYYPKKDDKDLTKEELKDRKQMRMAGLVRSNVYRVVEMLEELGYDADTLADEFWSRGSDTMDHM